MIEALEYTSDKIGIIMGAAFAVIIAIAVIRTAVKASRGESVRVPPVGVLNDLPCSITGVNKHDDLAERSNERSEKKKV